jgi:DNA-binding transcriptional LysR family regulator
MSEVLDYRIFVRAVSLGNMSQVARELGLSAAVISKRLGRLEDSLGVRLLNRTTRHISLTEAGRAFHDHIQAALVAIDEAESAASGGSSQANGVLKISAPSVFSRLHITPKLGPLLEKNPGLMLSLDINDGYTDLVADGTDVAIRIMAPENSSLIARRLAPNRRLLCASPDYLARFGTPKTLDDLEGHRLLNASAFVKWRMEGPSGPVTLRPSSVIETNSSDAVREMVIAGLGISLRSTWDVSQELRRGNLVHVLPDYRGASDIAIYAVYSSRRFVPMKIRIFVDYLTTLYGSPPYWDEGLVN